MFEKRKKKKKKGKERGKKRGCTLTQRTACTRLQNFQLAE
jgi:hypothetical protein